MYTKDEGDRRTILAALDYHGASATMGASLSKALAGEMRREARSGFHMSIELGNAEMRDTDDVVRELRTIAGQLHQYGPTSEGTICDLNGNTVGAFTLVLPEPETITVKARDLERGQSVKLAGRNDFQLVEMAEPMPGDCVEVITEPHSEGFLVGADQEFPVLVVDEDA